MNMGYSEPKLPGLLAHTVSIAIVRNVFMDKQAMLRFVDNIWKVEAGVKASQTHIGQTPKQS